MKLFAPMIPNLTFGLSVRAGNAAVARVTADVPNVVAAECAHVRIATTVAIWQFSDLQEPEI